MTPHRLPEQPKPTFSRSLVNLAYNTADPAAIAELREHWEGEFAGTEVLLEGSYAASMIDFTWG